MVLPRLLPHAIAATAAAAVSIAVAPAAADVVTIPAAADATLYEDPAGTIANGAGQHFFAGTNGSADFLSRRALIRFDLAGAIPSGATITGVTLVLNMSRASTPEPAEISLHRLLAGWSEGASDADGNEGSGAPATPGSATWIHRGLGDALWSTPGGDFLPDASAAAIVSNVGVYQWSSPAMIADVQSWLDGGAANFGWALLGDESAASTAKRFDSRENPDPALRPMLIVQYVPAPGAGACGAMLLAAAGGRRRPRRTA